MMELRGVLYFGCSRVNHLGSRLSQPATIGSRELALKVRLAVDTTFTSSSRIVTGARILARPNERNPPLSACGIGPTRLTSLDGTKARIALVPKMYRSAMIGAANKIDGET